MNRKQYLISVAVLVTASIALIITNYFFNYLDNWLYVVIIISLGYLFLKYKVSGPLQMFATRFSMMVDYDLDVEGAVEMCQKAYENAPTLSIKALYQVYYGMSLYYAGRYAEAIKILNLIDLKRLNAVYHVLIFAFVCYASAENEDMETFRFTLDRIKNIQGKVGPKYQGFVASYLEILEAILNIDDSLDRYKEVMERHFTREDGYISTKLVYNYRMAYYYKKLGDTLEMDKCLAFVIANGKGHHTALRAKEMFKGSVNVEDYVYVDPAGITPVETQEGTPEQPTLIETQSGKTEENENPEDKKEEE